jgi:hypothetical protein
MGAVAVTYSVVCLTIGLYAGWVWTRQRRLARQMRELRLRVEREQPREEIRSKAA